MPRPALRALTSSLFAHAAVVFALILGLASAACTKYDLDCSPNGTPAQSFPLGCGGQPITTCKVEFVSGPFDRYEISLHSDDTNPDELDIVHVSIGYDMMQKAEAAGTLSSKFGKPPASAVSASVLCDVGLGGANPTDAQFVPADTSLDITVDDSGHGLPTDSAAGEAEFLVKFGTLSLTNADGSGGTVSVQGGFDVDVKAVPEGGGGAGGCDDVYAKMQSDPNLQLDGLSCSAVPLTPDNFHTWDPSFDDCGAADGDVAEAINECWVNHCATFGDGDAQKSAATQIQNAKALCGGQANGGLGGGATCSASRYTGCQ